jgi:lipopolysaccharide/colanic/teichoic acid biosynthesis glycosyltransferase
MNTTFERSLVTSPGHLSTVFWTKPRPLCFLWQAIGFGEQALALLLSAISLPVLLCSALAVAALSRQAPFVAHRRLGLSGRTIWVWKLRTMWGPDRRRAATPILFERLTDTSVPLKKADHDPRITSRFALFLRKYSIDELPQLWQVVLGQLALVGPRPLTEAEIACHYGLAMAKALLSVKPGITGLWQVSGRNRLSYEQRKKLDQYLLDNWTVRLHLKILWSSVFCVVTGKDAH